MSGRIESIFLAPQHREPVRAVEEVSAEAGRGLRGDRHFATEGHGRGGDVTLIEMEVLEELAAEAGIELPPGATRRQVHTRGVALNDLVGKTFAAGEVVLRGVELCEPCRVMAEGVGEPGVIRALVHKGGIRASIVESGTIRVGDPVVVQAELDAIAS
jgi:MOSC domain-containing protein YiiM